jgi:hypothetical protein
MTPPPPARVYKDDEIDEDVESGDEGASDFEEEEDDVIVSSRPKRMVNTRVKEVEGVRKSGRARGKEPAGIEEDEQDVLPARKKRKFMPEVPESTGKKVPSLFLDPVKRTARSQRVVYDGNESDIEGGEVVRPARASRSKHVVYDGGEIKEEDEMVYEEDMPKRRSTRAHKSVVQTERPARSSGRVQRGACEVTERGNDVCQADRPSRASARVQKAVIESDSDDEKVVFQADMPSRKSASARIKKDVIESDSDDEKVVYQADRPSRTSARVKKVVYDGDESESESDGEKWD